MRVVLVLLAVLLSAAPVLSQSREATRALTARFGMGDLERSLLDSGYDTVERIVSPASDGIALIGGIWVEARPDLYLQWAEDFAEFDRGSSVQAVRRLSSPPALSDFDTLTLSKEELRELSRCRVGDCSVQLDHQSIARIAAIDWRARDAEARATAIVREMMFGIAARYAEIGDAGLPDYHDSRRITDVTAACASLIDEDAAAGLTPPALLEYFRGRPADVPAGATSYLYWTTNTFGLKPTTRLNHTVVYRGNGTGMAGVVATKMLYATHYFHGGLEMRYIMAEPDARRFLLVDVSRSRSDGLTGVTGAVLGDTIRRRALEGLRKYLRFTKESIERRQRLGGTRAP